MKQIFAIVTVILATALFAAAQTPADKQIEAELLRIQREMIDTSLRGDKSAFERYTTDTYLETDFNGAVTTRARILDNFLTPPASMKPTLEIQDVQVRVVNVPLTTAFASSLGTRSATTRTIYRSLGSRSKLFSAFAAADFRAFRIGVAARCGMKRNIAIACASGLPFTAAPTRRTFRGVMRTFFATA